MKILIKTLNEEKTMSLQVGKTESIMEIKVKIEEKKAIPYQDQILIFEGKKLKDETTLDYYKIHKESTVYLINRLKADVSLPGTIFVNSLDLKPVKCEIGPNQSVKDLKSQLKAKLGIPTKYQILIFEGKTLQNESSLIDCQIKKESTIYLINKLKNFQPLKFPIFIKPESNRIVVLDVEPTETVENLKSKISSTLKMQVDEIKLLYKGKKLENWKTLFDYSIQKDFSIDLVRISKNIESAKNEKNAKNSKNSKIQKNIESAKNSINSINDSKEKKNSTWRDFVPGFNIESKCSNKDCKAFGEYVIIKFGIGKFDLLSKKVLKKCLCPECKKILDPEKPAFFNCQWKFQGVKKEKEKEKLKNKKFINQWKKSDEYEIYQVGEINKDYWKSLSFQTKKK
ncbi:polyubiquitin-c [Anaeramoeba ignava]|uniref:Polyubiquitin-c n=1 Tax=Anaeramoeba ignava TaxID=1746090 RepID=A0A9Q0LSD6_ANAIG|nr:polyubiquitin-c [Anaeramoeba ignava]